MLFSENFMRSVENQFTKFMVVTTLGIRKDYYRKLSLQARRESYLCEFALDSIENIESSDIESSFDSQDFKNEILSEALKTLTPRQKDILLKILLEGWTEEDVAKSLGKSQPYVSQTKTKAIKKIRAYYEGVDYQ